MHPFKLAASYFLILAAAAAANAQNPPPIELWYWHHSYLTSPAAVQSSEVLIDQALAAGYTGVAFWDSSFSFMSAPFWPPQNVAYLEEVMNYASAKGLKIAGAVAPYGYSNDALQNNPNWAESQRVFGSEFKVNSSGNSLQFLNSFPGLVNPGFESGRTAWFGLGDSGIGVDHTVSHSGTSSGIIQNAGGNARFWQPVTLIPWRQYHLRLFFKTQSFHGFTQTEVIDAVDGSAIRINPIFKVSSTQNWTQVDYIFNSQASGAAYLYFGVWGGCTGTMWFDDILLEETSLIFVTRRVGTPVTVYDPQNPAIVYREGTDYNHVSDPAMASRTPFTNLYHQPPAVGLPAGTQLKPGQVVAMNSYSVSPMPYAGVQVGMCLTAPGTLQWLARNAAAVNAALPAGAGYFMQYDEMRQMNSCAACKAKKMTPGQLLAWHVGQAIQTYDSLRPGAPLFVWSDMFDPYHNAHADYYDVEGDIAGSWLGLPAGVTVMNWNLQNLPVSLKWFSGLNPSQPTAHLQFIAGYYDSGNGAVSASTELAQAAGVPGVRGLMYTTWIDDYSQLQSFAIAAKAGWPAYLASVGLAPATR